MGEIRKPYHEAALLTAIVQATLAPGYFLADFSISKDEG